MYSNSCCSCSFEREIIKIGQSSHKMYSNHIVNFQEATTILNACIKKFGNLLKAPRIYLSIYMYVCMHIPTYCRKYRFPYYTHTHTHTHPTHICKNSRCQMAENRTKWFHPKYIKHETYKSPQFRTKICYRNPQRKYHWHNNQESQTKWFWFYERIQQLQPITKIMKPQFPIDISYH